MPILFLLFVVVPIVEIALFVQVGGAIGLVPTLVIVIGTAALGTFMLRQQGLKTWAQAQARLKSGQVPATEMLEGLLLLVGGVLLLTPGFMTDALGFVCLLPPTRHWLVRRIGRHVRVAAAASVGGAGPGATGGAPPGLDPFARRDADPYAGGGFEPDAGPAEPSRKARDGEVIDGEFERIDRDA